MSLFGTALLWPPQAFQASATWMQQIGNGTPHGIAAEVHNWHCSVCWMQQRSSRHNTDKYDRGLSSLLHHQLHWFKVPERIEYKLAVMVHRCLKNKAPTYLRDHCTPVSSRHLRSANQLQLSANRLQLSCFLCCGLDSLELTTDWVSWSVCRFCDFKRIRRNGDACTILGYIKFLFYSILFYSIPSRLNGQGTRPWSSQRICAQLMNVVGLPCCLQYLCVNL